MGKKLEMARAHRMVGEMHMLLSDFENAKDQINTYLSKSSILMIEKISSLFLSSRDCQEVTK